MNSELLLQRSIKEVEKAVRLMNQTHLDTTLSTLQISLQRLNTVNFDALAHLLTTIENVTSIAAVIQPLEESFQRMAKTLDTLNIPSNLSAVLGSNPELTQEVETEVIESVRSFPEFQRDVFAPDWQEIQQKSDEALKYMKENDVLVDLGKDTLSSVITLTLGQVGIAKELEPWATMVVYLIIFFCFRFYFDSKTN